MTYRLCPTPVPLYHKGSSTWSRGKITAISIPSTLAQVRQLIGKVSINRRAKTVHSRNNVNLSELESNVNSGVTNQRNIDLPIPLVTSFVRHWTFTFGILDRLLLSYVTFTSLRLLHSKHCSCSRYMGAGVGHIR